MSVVEGTQRAIIVPVVLILATEVVEKVPAAIDHGGRPLV